MGRTSRNEQLPSHVFLAYVLVIIRSSNKQVDGLTRFSVVVMFSLMMVFAIGCGSDSNSLDSDALALADAQLAVEEFGYQRLPNGDRVVMGLLKNPTSRHVQNAQVQISFYDEMNQAVGQMLVLVQDIDPGTEKSFRQHVDRDDVAGARVRAIMAR
jgi:hypothetical protein